MSGSKQEVKVASVTKSESLVLMKNMIRISISSICYMRDLFPKDCFKNKEYGSVDIHQLQAAIKDDKGDVVVHNNDAFLLTQWLEKGVFAALESEYLSSMTFAILCKHPVTGEDLLLESYEFRVSFNDGSAKINDVSLISREVVKNQAAKFIRSLTEFSSTLDTLPDSRWITLQLKYRDGTPIEFEPEFFCAAPNGPFSGLDRMPLVINVGSVKTNSLDMRVKYAGLESFLFEDLKRVGSNQSSTPTTSPAASTSAAVSPVPSHSGGLFQGVSHATSPSIVNGNPTSSPEETLAHDLQSKALVTPTGTLLSNPAEAASKRKPLEEKEEEDKVFLAVKQFILAKGVSTVKNCAGQMHMHESEVRKAFARLVQEGIIQQKNKKNQNYSLSQTTEAPAGTATMVPATVTQPSTPGPFSRSIVTVIPDTDEDDADDHPQQLLQESIENTPPSQQEQSPSVLATTTPAVSGYRASSSPYARSNRGIATAAQPLVMQAPVAKPVAVSAAAPLSVKTNPVVVLGAAPSKAVVGGNGIFQSPVTTKEQKTAVYPTEKMPREAFDLQSLSQSSDEGGITGATGGGPATKRRKYSVIKDPINLRALY